MRSYDPDEKEIARLNALIIKEAREQAIFRSLLSEAKMKHGADIIPCNSDSWDKCFFYDDKIGWILWFNLPNGSTGIVKKAAIGNRGI